MNFNISKLVYFASTLAKWNLLWVIAFVADVLLASHAILPFLLGKGTRDEALRTSPWEAMGVSRGKASLEAFLSTVLWKQVSHARGLVQRVLHLMSNFSNYYTGKTHLADIMKTFSSNWLINDILTTDTSEGLFYFLNKCLQGRKKIRYYTYSILLLVINAIQ